jgi:pyruvate/2-oxoglutarate dehydrogenase complex dihydrolipoamide acyltransferase (E2) component
MPKGYRSIPFTFNRRVVAESASLNRKKNIIHSLIEVDISLPRQRIREHFKQTGEKRSFTAFLVASLGYTLKDHPHINAFRKGRRLILLDEVTVNVLIEREIQGELVPDSLGIQSTQAKSFAQIHQEIRQAQATPARHLGDTANIHWFQWIPRFLLRTFFRMADRNIALAKKYGKVSITSVGMHFPDGGWFIPAGGATVLLTVGGIRVSEGREYLHLTVSFDHDIVDGAPAARFLRQLTEVIRTGTVLDI